MWRRGLEFLMEKVKFRSSKVGIERQRERERERERDEIRKQLKKVSPRVKVLCLMLSLAMLSWLKCIIFMASLEGR